MTCQQFLFHVLDKQLYKSGLLSCSCPVQQKYSMLTKGISCVDFQEKFSLSKHSMDTEIKATVQTIQMYNKKNLEVVVKIKDTKMDSTFFFSFGMSLLFIAYNVYQCVEIWINKFKIYNLTSRLAKTTDLLEYSQASLGN